VYDVELSSNAANVGGQDLIFCVCRDVSERKLAMESQTRLVTAVEQSAEAIVITDTDAKILYVNPAFEKITGYTRAEALGQNPRILKSSKHNAEFYLKMWATLIAAQMWHGHFINKHKNGTLFEEEATISPVRDATGKVINYVAVKRDVTREIAQEAQNRQAAKMESIGQLAGGVAHDFNNKLQVIDMCAEILLNKVPPDHPFRADLSTIRAAVADAARLTRQLLTFSRQEAISPRVLDMNTAISGSLKMLGRLIGENIQVSFEQQTNAGHVFMDPGQLDQILANLAINSRDAIASTGHIFITAIQQTLQEADCRDKTNFMLPGDYVVLTISDDGKGMTPEIQARIFEPFFTTKGVGKGTGLGLATVYGIVSQNKGAITVQSEPGQGTTFTIYLPRSPDASHTVKEKVEMPKPTGTETVLLVEDEGRVLKLVQRILAQQGYNILQAHTPAEALKRVEQYAEPIHLLLTDVIMPGMSGLEMAERLQKLRPGMRVLYMSGYTADIMKQHGDLLEGFQVMQKPFTGAALAQCIRATLDAPPPTPRLP
jgi:PAS domain S-box-containing protein